MLTLKEVSHVVQRMADGLKQFSETADRLNQLGLIIQMLAQSFHLNSQHSLKHLAETWAGEVRRRLGNWEAIERLLGDLLTRQPYVECLLLRRKGGQVASPSTARSSRPRLPAAVRAGEGFADLPYTCRAGAPTILTPRSSSL